MEQTYEVQGVRPQPFANPQQQYGSSISTLTNPENDLFKMELSLRNMILDKEGNAKPVGEPLMNDAGISSVMGQVQAIVSQTTIMSNFDKREEIGILTEFLAETLAKDLMINRVSYGIRTQAARSKVYYISITSAYICLKRALSEGERRFWKGTEQNIRQIIEQPGQNSPGFFQKLLGFAKRN
jgi:hypothetical protein